MHSLDLQLDKTLSIPCDHTPEAVLFVLRAVKKLSTMFNAKINTAALSYRSLLKFIMNTTQYAASSQLTNEGCNSA